MSDGIRRLVADNATSSRPLTRGDMDRLFAQAARPRPPHHHVISPRATPGGWAYCGGCGAPVRVPDPWPAS